MVSYYNALPYSQKHSAANLAYSTGQPWNWTPNYHTPPNHQFLSDMETTHAHHQMYYNPHHMFHTAAAASATSDWHSPTSTAADNFAQNIPASAHQLMQQHHVAHQNGLASNLSGSSSTTSSGSISNGPTAVPGATHINDIAEQQQQQRQQQQQQQQQQHQQQHITEGLPSPPITVSGSEISSPGAPASASSPHHIAAHHLNSSGGGNSSNSHNHNTSPILNNNNNNTTVNNNNRASPTKPQYYDWMKKPAYPAQPQPGKTRTKDKYRVVYTDYQRLELEKEYCTSRYITIRRKSELAQSLNLSERQVKIWFQNRRAKERKQNKKGSDPTVMSSVQHAEYANLLDAKTKLEPGLHLQHPLHSMSPMMPMRLHPHLAAHSHLAAAAHSHQLQHHSAQMSAAAAVSVASLSM